MSVRHRCSSALISPRLLHRLSTFLANPHSWQLRDAGFVPVNGIFQQLGTLVEHQPEGLVSSKWQVVRRPVLDMELRRYAQSPVVPQALLLHGPRGVGKRTTVDGLLQEWRKAPHALAYVDFSALKEAASEGYDTPPWTLCEDSLSSSDITGETSHRDLGRIRKQLEQALESLAIEAIEVGCLNAKNVFDVLVDQHAIDGVLTKYLQARQPASEGLLDDFVYSGTKQLWREALRHLSDSRATSGLGQFSIIKATGSFEGVSNETTHIGSEDTVQPLKVGRYKKRALEAGILEERKDKAILSLALAKQLLQMQEGWKYAAGSERRSHGRIPRGVADAAVSWPLLLLHLVSWATQEGRFQPKLVILAIEAVRNASMDKGGVDGAVYHDCLLLGLVSMGLTHGSFPIILVSSDSYYSWKLGDDFGSTNVFVSKEVFGWTPTEASLHLVPSVFSADEWKVVTGVLGSNPRHLVELQSIWYSKDFSKRRREDESVDMEDCIDLYLAHLQVTAVDPAMEAAVVLLENFADKASKGHVDYQVLQHGAPWRAFPRVHDKTKQQRWAQLQLMDFIQALADTEFGVNYLGGGLELLDDPAARALVQVGLLYQQRDYPYIRPTSRGILRCLARWLVREKLCLSLADKVRFRWHRLIRGRYYRHLMLDSL